MADLGRRWQLLISTGLLALVMGQAVSLFGDWVNQLALIAFIGLHTAGFQQDGSALEMSKLSAAMTIPALLIGPVIGIYVDRMNKRKVMITADLFRSLLALMIPVLAITFNSYNHVFVIVFAMYAVNLFFLPARCAIIPEIVPQENLLTANSIVFSASVMAFAVGSTVGGLLVESIGAYASFAVNALSYLISAIAIALIPAHRTAPGRPLLGADDRSVSSATLRSGEPVSWPTGFVEIWHELVEGLRQVRRLEGVLFSFIALVLLCAVTGMAYVLAIPLIQQNMPSASLATGLVTGSVGLGIVVGATLAARLGRRFPRKKAMLLGLAVFGVAAAALPQTLSLPVLCLSAMLGGWAASPSLVAGDTIMHECLPADKRARVFAARDAVTKASFLGASVLAGVVAKVGDPKELMLVAGVVMVLAASIMAVHFRRLKV